MMKWFRMSRLSIKKTFSLTAVMRAGGERNDTKRYDTIGNGIETIQNDAKRFEMVSFCAFGEFSSIEFEYLTG